MSEKVHLDFLNGLF